jgi:hypothetical protein
VRNRPKLLKKCLSAQGFDMGTVPQSHEKRIRQTNRPQVAALLPAEPDFFSDFEPFRLHVEALTN